MSLYRRMQKSTSSYTVVTFLEGMEGWTGDTNEVDIGCTRRTFPTRLTWRYHFDNDKDGALYRADQSRLAWAIHDVVVSACCPVLGQH